MSVEDYWTYFGFEKNPISIRALTLLCLAECPPLPLPVPLPVLLEVASYTAPGHSPTVIVRLRPLFLHEEGPCVARDGNSSLRFNDNIPEPSLSVASLCAGYAHILGPESTQEDIYGVAGSGAVRAFLEGRDACVVTYGQRGTGKTYTIFGGDKVTPGLLPRVAEALKYDGEETITMSVIEIYKAKIIDLLDPTTSSQPLRMRCHPTKGFYVEGVCCVPVKTSAEVMGFVQKAKEKQIVRLTMMSERSSHSVFIVQFFKGEVSFALVDNVGSEKVNKCEAAEHVMHTVMICKSNTSLKNVVRALSQISTTARDDKTKPVHVPYRDHPLTMILQRFLSGPRCAMTVIGTISPALEGYEETVSTLRFMKLWATVRPRG